MAAEKIDALSLDITSNLNTANLDKLITKLNELGKTLDGLKGKSVAVNIRETGEASKTASSGVDKLTSSFASQAIKITAVIALFRKLSSVISSSIANSATYIKSLNMFTVTLGQYADSATKYGQTVSDALGIDIAGWQETQGVFSSMMKGVGIVGDQAAYMSQQLTQLAYDWSTFYGITVEEAANKIKSGLAGRTQPVRKLGFAVDQTEAVDYMKNPKNYGKQTYAINEQTGAIEANTRAYADNTAKIVGNYNQLDTATKYKARYNLLIEQSSHIQGNFARSLNDPYNQLRIFKDQLNQTSRAFGNMFIPALNKVLPYLSAFAQLATEAFQSLAQLFGFELPDMKDRTNINTKPYDDVVKKTGSAAKNAKKMKDYMLGIDELNVFNPNTGAGAGGGTGSKNKNNNLDDMLLKGYDFLGKSVENSIKEAKKKIQKFFEDLKANPLLLKDLFVWGWEDLGDKVGSNFWEWVLGKTPAELAEEAAKNGRTVGEEFMSQLGGTFQLGIEGIDTGFWTWVLGKSPDDLAKDAENHGLTLGGEFMYSFGLKLGEFSQPLWNLLLGTPEDLAKRATEAGNTVGDQFAMEFLKAFYKLGKGNPILEFLSKQLTGKSLDEMIKEIDNKVAPKIRDSKALNEVGKFKVSIDAGNGTDIAKKWGDQFNKGLENKAPYIEKTADTIFNTSLNSLSGGSKGRVAIVSVGESETTSYANGISSKYAIEKVESAANKVGKAGVNKLKTFNNSKNNISYPNTGDNAGAGYIFGINKHKDEAKKVGGIIGLNSLNQIRKTLGIKSPSREFAKVGKFAVEGYADAIENNTNLATKAVTDMAKSSLSRLVDVSSLSNRIILNGNIADPMSNNRVSMPSTTNAGYGIAGANGEAMANLASSVYQAVVSGMATANLNGDRETNIIIDGKAVFKAVETEKRKRGATVGNGTFSR